MKTQDIDLSRVKSDKGFLAASSICNKLKSSGFEAFLVGGCVRDLIMGTRPKDWDITTSALPKDVKRLFPNAIPVGVQFGVIRVFLDGQWFEVATYRGEAGYYDGRHPTKVWFSTLKQDVLRRDFTMNALVLDPQTARIHDHVGGLQAIAQRSIQAIGDPKQRFGEDKLRMLRAVRFAAQLDFTIEPATMDAIRTMAAQIMQVSRERIREEMEKLLNTAQPGKGLELARDLGLLARIFPDVEHLQHADLLRLGNCLADLQALYVKWAILLYKAGPDMAHRVMTHLHASNKACAAVSDTVRALNMGQAFETMNMAERKRLIRGNVFADAVDAALTCGHLIGIDTKPFISAMQMLKVTSKMELFPEPLLTGKDLQALGYEPGPRFGYILKRLEDAQLSGEIRTKQDALNLVKDLMGAITTN